MIARTLTLAALLAAPAAAADPRKAFAEGAIGTELAPLPVMLALPDLFPDYFQPRGRGNGDWVEQYGFLRRDAKDDPLPVGLNRSGLQPQTADPSPVPFVGFACGACHSHRLRLTRSDPGQLVLGAGNPNLNLLAYSEAFRGALSAADPATGNPRLTAETVGKAVKARTGKDLTPVEQAVVAGWVGAARAADVEFQKVVDDPLAPHQVMNPALVPAGPGRTQPFRSLVRVVLDRPGAAADAAAPDHGFSKVPAVYHQAKEYHGDWAQFDGSVKNPTARSSLAAMTAGATLKSLAHPEVAGNIKAAAEYTLHLKPTTWDDVPALRDRYPTDPGAADRGMAVYRRHCFDCHGGPGPDRGWRPGAAGTFGEVVDVGTDAERIRFRHRERLAKVVFDRFDKYEGGHPLRFGPDDVRAPAAAGYYAGPIGGVITRAPYLHNASVPTAAELIHLKPRRAVFFRGDNLFDPADVGLLAPAARDRYHYFRFDTKVRGNGNRGHDYPWPPRPGGWTDEEKAQLSDLLEYLKGV